MTNKTIYGCTPFASNIDNKFHYVYRITNLVENKHYYGVKSSEKSPELVMGKSYFGSPQSENNRWIIQDQKVNPSNYKYKILRCFETRKEALAFEVLIHSQFDVKNHTKFYNEANQTQTGFDSHQVRQVRKGKCTVINKESGEVKMIDQNEFDKNHYNGLTFGKVTAKNLRTGLYTTISKEEFIKNKELYEHNSKGKVRVLVLSTEESKTVTKEEFYTNRHLYLQPKQIPKWRKLRDSNS